MRGLEKIKRVKILDKHLSKQNTERHAASLSKIGPSHVANGNAVDGKTVFEHFTRRMIYGSVDARQSATAAVSLELVNVRGRHENVLHRKLNVRLPENGVIFSELLC